jgi:flagellin
VGLVVNTNVASLNAQRSMNVSNAQLQKSFERLSSGLRINRAGDDAAGLAISERMRSTIKSLEQAQRNTDDGVSLVQTAEGAYNEVHSILGRMRELGVQSSNGTLTSADRANVNEEFTALSNEVTRIANSTNFNGIQLLNANSTTTLQVGSGTTAGTDTLDVGLFNSTATALGVNSSADKFVSGSFASGSTVVGGAGGNITLNFDAAYGGGSSTIAVAGTDTISDVVGKINNAGISGVSASLVTNADTSVSIVLSGTKDKVSSLAADAGLGAALNGMETEISGSGIDVTTVAKAQASVQAIDLAINAVSTNRSKLGAIQNRLESANRDTANRMENLVAAESRIRDVDVAKESARLTRNQILQQAGIAILSQANQSPQAALSLLRG